MASDVLTARSLPLPGTFLFKNHSWILRMYAKGLLNFRTGVVVPAVGIAITEVSTRRRLKRTAEEAIEVDRNLILQQVHLQDVLVSGTAATILFFVPGVSAAASVALGASAVWSTGATTFYLVRRHHTEIKSAMKSAAREAQGWVDEAHRRLATRHAGPCQSTLIQSEPAESVGATSGPAPRKTSASSVGWAAVFLIVASALKEAGSEEA